MWKTHYCKINDRALVQSASASMLLLSHHTVVWGILSLLSVFTARRNARIESAVLAIAIASVCPSVRPSHAGIVCHNDGT